MKKAAALMAVVLSLGLGLGLGTDAEAKRLGGGKSAGMQRQSVNAPPQGPGSPAGSPSQAAPAAAGAAAAAPAAAAAASKRSWMGPIAGLAAGLGLAALASHFGFGAALANIMTMVLIGLAVLMLVGFFMRKRAQAQQGAAMAGAGAPAPFLQPQAMERSAQGGSMIGSGIGGGLGGGAAPVVGNIPAGFDVDGFVRNAKTQFVALQAANDTGDLGRLREYLTPELFESVRAEIAERGAAPQKTEVFGLEARVLEVVEEPEQYVVSVRFTGSIRDQAGATPEDLEETWHLVKPRTGWGGWVIAGIQQA
jgi:predicted lipid-binding transport protein (Tim44 family)